MISPPRTGIPVPTEALDRVFPSPPRTPAEAAHRAGVLLVAQAGTCQDPNAREHGRHLRAAEIAKANKQLARTQGVYRWNDLPQLANKEY
ncbi:MULTISPECIES: hypothetical protein [unclassified Streptomyces]|uniref:hypothetical protein n=1 Tax=unclassified Streptomyces TaxID=2593676 RepID=UPI00278C3B21|nr:MULTISPECIES: hypothetical protein [unclassified Streptomyces]